MTSILKPAAKHRAKGPVVATVRDEKTGRTYTVKGVGALKDSPLKIKKGVSLLKPIAEQVLVRRSKRRKA